MQSRNLKLRMQKKSSRSRKWKAAGSAGREHEDRLWNAFNESRQKFYDRRGEYYDQLHEQQDGKYEEKRRLVEQANEIAQRGE